MYIRQLIFSCDPLNLFPAVHFLSTWLRGIMAIKNSNGDSASPWNKPLWIFALVKLLPPAVNSTLQVFIVFSIKFMTSFNTFVHFETVYYSVLRDHIICLFVVNSGYR